MSVRRWMLVLGLLLALSGGLILVNRPVAAASAGCTALNGLTNTLDNSSNWSIGSFDFEAGEAISVTATEDGSTNQYPVTLTVGALSQTGSSASVTIPSAGNYAVSVMNSPDASQVINVSCSAPPPPASSTPTATATATLTPVPPTATTAPSNTPRPTATRWPGYTDGRLGGDPAEYYSLWCSGNTLNIWSAASGRGVQLAAIPLTNLIVQPVGLAVPVPAAGGVLILTRSSSDAFVVQGNTGNGAPAPGSKAFSLAACIAANGGAPVVAPTMTPLLRTVLPTRTPTRPPSRTPSPTPSPTATPTLVTTPFVFGVAGLLTSSNDTDGDGTADGYDLCKYEPGPVYGCTDFDGDGLAGPWDLCPTLSGVTSLRGCPDADGDGVSDTLDLCPSYAPPTDQNAQGCLDNDRDGVPNIRDWCPLQVKVAGVSQFQGCNDPDGDGYVNGVAVPAAYQDNCPTVNGVNFDNGCPPPTPLPAGGVTVTPTLSLFDVANQLGSFDGLTLRIATATPTCSRGSYGFCLGN
jgi:hypothetical protein